MTARQQDGKRKTKKDQDMKRISVRTSSGAAAAKTNTVATVESNFI
jgi:hypothetical protein